MNQAEAHELERLATMREQHVTDWYVLFDQYDSNAYSVAEQIAFTILGKDSERGRCEAREFWDQAVGDDDVSRQPEFVRGFVEGALKVWGEVADDL